MLEGLLGRFAGKSTVLLVALLGMAALVLALGSASASAAITHPFAYDLTETPNGPLGNDVCGVTVDPNNARAYVSNPKDDAIEIFDSAGVFKKRISGADSPGSFQTESELACPVGVNSQNGRVYFAKSLGYPSSIEVFDGSGNYLSTMTDADSPDGFGDNYLHITVDPNTGEIYAAGSQYNAYGYGIINKFSPAGVYESQINGMTYPWTMGVDSNSNLYVLDTVEHVVKKFDPDGDLLATFTGTPYGHFEYTIGMAVGGNDHVFVLEPYGYNGTGLVYELDENGNYLGQTKGLSIPSGGFSSAEAVAAGPTGNVYVADRPGSVHVFGPPVTVPSVTTGQPTSIGHDEVDVAGTVNPSDATLAADCHLEWGPDGYMAESPVPCSPPGIPGGTADVAVSAHLSGLTPGTTYYYRFASSNDNGDNFGATRTVTPVAVLDVTTGAATSLQRTSAVLNGSLDPDGIDTDYYFEYGENTNYGSRVPATDANAGSGTGTTPVSQEATGLNPGTTYHYRLVASNEIGSNAGEDRTFTTPPAVGSVNTEAATAVQRTTATLHGSFDRGGEGTEYLFEYGLNTNYGQQVPASPVDVGTGGPISVSQPLGGLQPGTTYHFRVVAINAVGTAPGQDLTFTTSPAVTGVTTGSATEISKTTATLNGTLDTDSLPTRFYFEYGVSKSYGQKAPLPVPPGGDAGSAPGTTPVSVAVTDLQSGLLYHYRLVATNSFGTSFGQDLTFTTAQGPTVESFSAANVTATTADLIAQINPHGYETKYRFEYGTTVSYGEVAPIPDGSAGSGTTPEKVVAQLTDLTLGATYHFRVVAESEFGTFVTEDQTFEFFTPNCPNAHVRQETGAATLPDCRAYELVTPGDAGGVTLSYEGPNSPYATHPSRLSFNGNLGTIPNTGNVPPNLLGDLYVATRTNGGWTTRYVGIPATQALEVGGPPNTPGFPGPATILGSRDMSEFLDWDNGTRFFQCCNEGSFAPYVWDFMGEPLGRLPTNLEEVPGGEGFVGAVETSADFKHFVFSSGGPPFSVDGLSGPPGSAYDNNRETGEVTLISLLPGNTGLIPQDPTGPADPKEAIGIPAISADGSHILMSTEATGNRTHLYMRVDNAETYDVSAGEDGVNHGVGFVAMSEDGSTVVFTSPEQLTDDDNDTSVDLYRWEEQGQTLTRLSKGDGEAGDTDECVTTWVGKCSVAKVTTVGSTQEEGIGPGMNTDNSFAEESGAIYFYSPEQLVGTKGSANERNLYLADGEGLHYVTTLDSESPLYRMQVTPDNSHAAFVTATRLTAYDNAGFREMYTYTPATEALRCVSCDPNGEVPTAHVEASQNGLFMSSQGWAFFSTADALVPHDTNGLIDVYEFANGRAQLITTGRHERDFGLTGFSGLVGVSADGTDAFFSTYDSLVAQDHNGLAWKIYDARINGGFPFIPDPAPCAAADECHGPGSSAQPQPRVTTRSDLGEGNFKSEKKKGKHKKAKKKRKAKKKHGKRKKGHAKQRGAQRGGHSNG